MARQKAANPTKQQPSNVMTDHLGSGTNTLVEELKAERKNVLPDVPSDSAGTVTLLICVGGIYASL